MGGNLVRFLLLLTTLGLASATVKITGTLATVNIAWTPKDTTYIFKSITILRNNTKIIETSTTKESETVDKLTWSCTVSTTTVNCNLKPNTEKILYEIYDATVEWKTASSEETSKDSDKKYVTKYAAVDEHVATKPNIKMEKDAVLYCSSTGVPAPDLVWKTTGTEPIKALNTGEDWVPTAKLLKSWSTYKATSDKYDILSYINALNTGEDWDPTAKLLKSWSTYKATSDKYDSITCVANGLNSDIFSKFVKLSKPTIRLTEIAEKKKILNCTSEGIPAPTLSWKNDTSKDDQQLKVDSSNSYWNSTRFVSWSTILPGDKNTNFTCTAIQEREGGTVKEISDVLKYYTSSAGKYGGPGALVVALMAVAFFTQSNHL